MTNVKMTDEEKRILQGGEGDVPRLCMEFIVETAECGGAEKLIDLDGTGDFHSPTTSMCRHYTFSYEALKELVNSGAHFKIPTFANKAPFQMQPPVHGWENCHMCMLEPGRRHDNAEDHKWAMMDEWYELYRKMGMMTSHSCANYLVSTYWPTQGQHCSWNESSAVPYCNAILGARTNIDGSFATCFLGKAAYYDMHITEKRYATVEVKTDRLIHTDLEWDLFGFAVGETVGVKVPCLTGTAKPTTTQICKMNSAMNTGGSIRMYHIPGTTPEAPSIEAAFHSRKPKESILIDEAVLRHAYDILNYNPTEDVDLVYLGCPHLTIVDLMLIARKLEDKKLKVPMWIMTAPWLYEACRTNGYLKIFQDAGADLMSGTCPAAFGGLPEGVGTVALDSAKQSYYITGRYPDENNPLHVCYGTQDDCIDAGLTGKWHGGWR